METEAVLDRFVEGLFHLMLDRHQARVDEMDLTMVQAQALKLLRMGPMSTGKLAGMLGITAPAVTQLTDRLGRKDLIERQASKSDRRAVIVTVTVKGRRLVDGFRQERVKVFAAALTRLSEEDQREVIAALSKILGVLHEPVEPVVNAAPKSSQPAAPQASKWTAVEPPEASYTVERGPISPPKRRIRIEWD
jgi:DNA-binding MarR family transcriptional regulator